MTSGRGRRSYAAFTLVLRAYAVRRGCDEPDAAVQDVVVKFGVSLSFVRI